MALIPANPTHYGDVNGLYMGKMYFLRSPGSGKFDGRPYFISEDTDITEFRAWFRNGMIYEPVSLTDEAVVEEKEIINQT